MSKKKKKDSISGCCVTSLILGIFAILSWGIFFVSLPLSILGILLAEIGIMSGKGGKGMGIAGLILSIVSFAPSLLTLFEAGFFTSKTHRIYYANLTNMRES